MRTSLLKRVAALEVHLKSLQPKEPYQFVCRDYADDERGTYIAGDEHYRSIEAVRSVYPNCTFIDFDFDLCR